MEPTHRVHIVAQEKGGVGKSLISSIIAQHYQRKQLPFQCYDTDPGNATLLGYQALHVRHVDLLVPTGQNRINGTNNLELNLRNFDTMIEEIAGLNCDVIIDNGASCFYPLLEYMHKSETMQTLADLHKSVSVHCIIVGSQAQDDTLRGFDWLARNLGPIPHLVIWLNKFFGPILHEQQQFEDFQVYHDHKHRVTAIVELEKQDKDLFGEDFRQMLQAKLTFTEALQSPRFGIASKQRITQMARHIFSQVEWLTAS